MTDDAFDELKKLNRERFHAIWETAKTGELDYLPDEERRVAEIMLEHEDEFFNQFEISSRVRFL